MDWTADDVEAVAQASVRDRIPPQEIMERLGPNPPHDFLHALGARTLELNEQAMRTYTIYLRPRDVPDAEYVVREFLIFGGAEPRPSSWMFTADSLEAARDAIPMNADYCMVRAPEDDPAIVETWL